MITCFVFEFVHPEKGFNFERERRRTWAIFPPGELMDDDHLLVFLFFGHFDRRRRRDVASEKVRRKLTPNSELAADASVTAPRRSAQ